MYLGPLNQEEIDLELILGHINEICKKVFPKSRHSSVYGAANILNIYRYKTRRWIFPQHNRGTLGVKIIISRTMPMSVEILALYNDSEPPTAFTAYNDELCSPDIFSGIRKTLEKLYLGEWRQWDPMDFD